MSVKFPNSPTLEGRERLIDTAYHEAGHAVVAWVLGIGIESVTIVPDGESLGRIRLRTSMTLQFVEAEHSDNPLRFSGRVRDRIEAEWLMSLAGDAAIQQKFNRNTSGDGAEADFDSTVRECQHITGCDNDVAGCHIKWLDARVAAMLRHPCHWAAVEALAEALLEEELLSGARVRKIVKQAMRDQMATNSQFIQCQEATRSS